MAKGVCYRCGALGTTREHFPPKSFFPKGGGLNLKTVRSCELHNNAKSDNDQYVLAQICMTAARGDNLAKERFLCSIAPQIRRYPKFQALLVDGARSFEGATAYRVDMARFDAFFSALSCAVLFDRFGEVVDEDLFEICHLYPHLHSHEKDEMDEVRRYRSMFKEFFEEHASHIQHFEADKIDEVVYANSIAAPAGLKTSVTIVHVFYGVFEVISRLTNKPFNRAVLRRLGIEPPVS
jgi:hypothetical protein